MSSKVIFALSFLLIAFPTYADNSQNNSQDSQNKKNWVYTPVKHQSVEVHDKDFEGVIFTCDNSWPYPCWTPTNEDIQILEKELKHFFSSKQAKEAAKDSGEVLKPLSKYKRQYIGLYKDGQKLIHVHLICNDEIKDDNWKSYERGEMIGGGSCYAHFYYDVQNKKFLDFFVEWRCF